MLVAQQARFLLVDKCELIWVELLGANARGQFTFAEVTFGNHKPVTIEFPDGRYKAQVTHCGRLVDIARRRMAAPTAPKLVEATATSRPKHLRARRQPALQIAGVDD